MDSRLKTIYEHLKKIERVHGYTPDAWFQANNYLDSHHIDSYFLSASGVTEGSDIINQCQNALDDGEYDDKNDEDLRNNLKTHIDNIDPHRLYVGETGLDAYNRHPEAGVSLTDPEIKLTSSDDIQLAFNQMLNSLRDFPERYDKKSDN